MNPQECAWEISIPHNHEDHVAGKGENSLQHYSLVHKFIPVPQAMKIPAAKAAVDEEWEKLENFFFLRVKERELSNHTPRKKNAFKGKLHIPSSHSHLDMMPTKPTPHGTMTSDHQHHHQVSNQAVSWQMRVLLHTPKSLTNAFAHACSALLCRMDGSLRAFALASFREERTSFWRPPAPDFTGQNDEARSATRPNEFWVGPSFTCSSSNQRDSVCVCSSFPRGPIAVQR